MPSTGPPFIQSQIYPSCGPRKWIIARVLDSDMLHDPRDGYRILLSTYLLYGYQHQVKTSGDVPGTAPSRRCTGIVLDPTCIWHPGRVRVGIDLAWPCRLVRRRLFTRQDACSYSKRGACAHGDDLLDFWCGLMEVLQHGIRM
jgi:hypothetical protein